MRNYDNYQMLHEVLVMNEFYTPKEKEALKQAQKVGLQKGRRFSFLSGGAGSMRAAVQARKQKEKEMIQQRIARGD